LKIENWDLKISIMQIIEITDKKQLNDLVGSQEMSQFLQSWEWGEFQEKVSGKVIRLGVEDGGRLLTSATIITKKLPLGKKYWYCPRGPIIGIRNQESGIMDKLFSAIEDSARRENVVFLRFEPNFQFQISNFKFPISKTLDVQPSKTLILDLSKPENELLAQMRQKTRYNVNLAAKKGVEVVEADQSRFAEFYHLLNQTCKRGKFRLHSQNYYQTMMRSTSGLIKLFFVQYQGRPLAAALVSFFGDTAVYLHGGSADAERNAMAPYLLHWHLIKLARAMDKKYYDFGGLDEAKWPGLTRFKRGFGGAEVNYPGAFDFIFRSGWYGIYKAARKIRRTF
jgi:lipid II:glycine glycyltransferase (peptidoglycan interpeptide bridge formation enzyme)